MPVLDGYDGNCAFGGVSFDVEELDIFLVPGGDVRGSYAIRHAPWGNRTVVQDLGQEASELAAPIIIYNTDFAALRALRGQSGTLDILGEVTYAGVVLLGIAGIRTDYEHGVTFANATFLGVW